MCKGFYIIENSDAEARLYVGHYPIILIPKFYLLLKRR